MDSRGSFQLEWLFDVVKGQFVPGTQCARLPTESRRCFPAGCAHGVWNPQEEVSASQVEEKLLSLFLLVPQTYQLMWNFNTHIISSFHKQQEDFFFFFAWAFRFVLREKHKFKFSVTQKPLSLFCILVCVGQVAIWNSNNYKNSTFYIL